ncbi:hypothetical protein ITP53_02340 [Nonomuraea sp. K274]|uniref:SGNH hydrolase-type esterase domain-containing protein n=1 Tax=Nonomuraea cypriaca TaxID=1187855 RepID=A0A931A1R4_9ACTN|nr:hypothetical protein [Nonomuraea cypriaca]
MGSETGHGWPDLLADRTVRRSPALAVVNEGVSGGRVLASGTGRHAEARLTAEVLTKPGVDAVILPAGINDIGAGARPDDLIAAYRRIVEKAHAAGVRVIGGTLLPFAGAEYHTETGERTRQTVNAFIRGAGSAWGGDTSERDGCGFDGVVDFDAALRDPAAPDRLLPRYDCGDHLHPSTAGHQAMAAAVELPLLRAGHPRGSQVFGKTAVCPHGLQFLRGDGVVVLQEPVADQPHGLGAVDVATGAVHGDRHRKRVTVVRGKDGQANDEPAP